MSWPTETKIARMNLKKWRFCILAVAVLGFASVAPVRAQDPPADPASKPTEPASAPPPKPSPKPNKDSGTSSAPDQPKWDPLRAEKDLEVGQYYMRRGDLDAAIDRFQDATEAKPGYAIPFRYLGDAQEKKGLKKQAIKSYTKYLDLYPHAEDKSKIQKKIDKLYKEVEKEKSQR